MLALDPFTARGVAKKKETADEAPANKKGRAVAGRKTQAEDEPKPAGSSRPLDIWDKPLLDGVFA